MSKAATETYSAQLDLLPASDLRQPDTCQRAALALAPGSPDYKSLYLQPVRVTVPIPTVKAPRCSDEDAKSISILLTCDGAGKVAKRKALADLLMRAAILGRDGWQTILANTAVRHAEDGAKHAH